VVELAHRFQSSLYARPEGVGMTNFGKENPLEKTQVLF
jgi:hypothetical protein